MARIQGVPQNQAGPVVKLVYRFMRRGMKKMTGRDAMRETGIEPLEQLVEITALLVVVNLDRFNAAFGIGAAGFSDGMVCVPWTVPPTPPRRRRSRARPDGALD